MARGVTTEWEDIHVRLGNYLPREKEPTMEELSKEKMEKLEEYDPLEKKDLEELKELEDEFDDEFLKAYRDKRKGELKKAGMRPKFGTVREISKQEYIAEVTNAPKGVFVVLHMYQGYVMESLKVNQILEQLAPKYPFVKFLKIVANKCIEKFDDFNVPAIIIYRDGALVKQLIPLKSFLLASGFTPRGLEQLLASLKIIEIPEGEEIEDVPEKLQVLTALKRREKDSADRSDDEDDREYASNSYWIYKH